MKTTTTHEKPTVFRLPLAGKRVLELGSRPRVMAVVNITPDSFSDGGRFFDPQRAVQRGLEALAEGADLLDLGAESTRPGGGVYGEGAAEVSVREELERLLPVLDALRSSTDVPISIDTRKPEVAAAALESGADLINDVGGLAEPTMRAVLARHDCPAILMHSRGELRRMQKGIRFRNVREEVAAEISSALATAERDGISRERIIVDPGIGFGKTAEQSLELLADLAPLAALSRPILIGASRKSFIGAVTRSPATDRLPGSLAAVGQAIRQPVAIVRVHDVDATVRFLRVWAAIEGRAAS